jgi:hypothetical protein
MEKKLNAYPVRETPEGQLEELKELMGSAIKLLEFSERYHGMFFRQQYFEIKNRFDNLQKQMK